MAKTTLLRRGSHGAAVRSLQDMLNHAARAPAAVVVDGHFGPATELAVKAAQRRLGLVMDGIAGPQTLKALKAEETPVKPGRAEPDKSAMSVASHPGGTGEKQPTFHLTGEAKPPPNGATLQLLDTARPIDEIIWHCAATPEGKDFTVADITAWHKARGWSDNGYHYIVYRDGRIMVARPVGQVGAHCAGHNTGTIGVSYIGGVSADGKTAKDTRTPAQRASMLWLRDQLMAKHKRIAKNSGHNQYAAKACPSFDVRQDALGRVAA